MRMSDIQALHDLLPAWGGVIELPAEEIEGGNGEEIIITKPVRLIGKGMNMSDSQLSRGLTQFNYTGSGVAVQLGTPAQATPLYGVELKDFTIKNTGGNGVAGIRVTGNTSQGILTARVLMENVDARGFSGGLGVGIDLNYGISVTLRRCHVHQNMYGVRVRWGNGYHFDGLIARHNGQGVRGDAFNGLTLTGWTILESNDYSGLLVSMVDNCRDLILDQVWVENNNIIASGANDGVFIQPEIAGMYLNFFTMRHVHFDGGRGNVGTTNVNYAKYERIRWNNGTYLP